MNYALAVLVLVFALLPRAVKAVEYPFGTVHVSSAEAGWGGSYAADGSSGTVWSSTTGNANTTQWIAAWWASPGYKAANYITLVPRWSPEKARPVPHSMHVPEMISIYADQSQSPGVWTLIKTVSIPKDIAQAGYRIYFPKILASGFYLVSSNLRGSDDWPADYRLQVAELKAGFEDRFSAWVFNYAGAGSVAGIDLQNTMEFIEGPNPPRLVPRFSQYATAPRLAVGVEASISKHPRNAVFATSSEAGYPPTNIIDGSLGSFWSSAAYSGPTPPSGGPEFAFWFGQMKEVNYIKLVPRFVSPPDDPQLPKPGRNSSPRPTYHVPEKVDIWYADYVGAPQWKLLVEDYALPDQPPEGLEASDFTGIAQRTTIAYEIPLPRHVKTDGFKIVAKTMRGAGQNNTGPYRFQLAEAYAGLVTVWEPGSHLDALKDFASANPGKLYIYGDEPDTKSYPPEAYAIAYKRFVDAIGSVDPKAKFSPGGIAWTLTDASLQAKAVVTYTEPGQPPGSLPGGHFLDWAQQFVDRYKTLLNNGGKPPPVAEWRFNIPGGISDPDFDNWKAKLGQADRWARSQGAQWAVGSFWLNCNPAQVGTNAFYMRKMMDEVKANKDIVTAAWWVFETTAPDSMCALYSPSAGARTSLGDDFYLKKEELLN
jgi:hypothetical protein